MTLESLLELVEPIVRGVSGHYRRRGWGLSLEYVDYLQEAYLAAVMVYRNHQELGRHRLIQMVRKAIVFRVRRLWQEELSQVYWKVDLTEGTYVVDLSALERMYFHHVFDEALRLTTGIYRELLIALLQPEPDDLTLMFCFELFRPWPEKAIQRAEFAYLASYLSLPRREVRRLFYELRHQLQPVFEGV